MLEADQRAPEGLALQAAGAPSAAMAPVGPAPAPGSDLFRELEKEIAKHPKVGKVCIVPTQNRILGENICNFVYLFWKHEFPG